MRPEHLDVDREKGLTVTWPGGATVFYPVGYLRRMSPSADQRELRAEQERNPLAVLPDSGVSGSDAPLTIVTAELAGNYAIRIEFSDGHRTGIFSWKYLKEIEPRDA